MSFQICSLYFKIKDTDRALNNYTTDLNKSEDSYVEIDKEQNNNTDGYYMLITNENNTDDEMSMDLGYFPNKTDNDSNSSNDNDTTTNQTGNVSFHFSLYDYMHIKKGKNNT